MERDFSLPELMKGISQKMILDFEEITRKIPSPLERGESREIIVRSFLKDCLPKRFGVNPGFVIDASGNVSKKMDVVIYDVTNAPVFKVIDEVKVFPVECVCAIAEVKSYLDKKEMKDAMGKIQSVKRLDKTNRGKSRTAMINSMSPSIEGPRMYWIASCDEYTLECVRFQLTTT